MASILALKRRITAAQNVSKTTRAMQMIAASKLKKAQIAAVSSRPYVEKLTGVVENAIKNVDKEKKFPYMEHSAIINKPLLIVLSPDKGLCGGLITNLTREFLHYSQTNISSSYVVIGKKLESQVMHFTNEVIASFIFGTTLPKFDMIYPILQIIDEYYLTKKVDSVKILYPHFTSIFTQTPKIITLLPVSIPIEEIKDYAAFQQFEPDLSSMLPNLLKHYVEMTLYQYLLESFVSEQASRMLSMQNATNNAKDIIEDLKLEYNSTRQSKITSEILDISVGIKSTTNEQ